MSWMENSYSKWTPGNPCMFDKFMYRVYTLFFYSLRYFKLFQRQGGWPCLFWNLLLPVDFTSHMQCFASDSRWWPIWILVLLWSSRPGSNGASTIGRQTCNFLTDCTAQTSNIIRIRTCIIFLSGINCIWLFDCYHLGPIEADTECGPEQCKCRWSSWVPPTMNHMG